jgi:hypothetical protein
MIKKREPSKQELGACDCLMHYAIAHTEDMTTRFVADDADIYAVVEADLRKKLREFMRPYFPTEATAK